MTSKSESNKEFTITCSIINKRNRSKRLVFATVQQENEVQPELIFCPSDNGLSEADVAEVRRVLRSGDVITATIYKEEPNSGNNGGPLWHVKSTTTTSIAIQSNTKISRTENKRKLPSNLPLKRKPTITEAGHEAADEDDDQIRSLIINIPKQLETYNYKLPQRGPGFSNHDQSWSRKCVVLKDFILSKFSISFLNSGSGVLDVAGGKGELTYLLMMEGVKCTLVDPREKIAQLNKRQRKAVTKRLGGEYSFKHVKEFFAPELFSSALVAECSLIVGMHPDEATHPLVDCAISYSKPAVVVPCCVYSRLFPERLIDETVVTTYGKLLKYIITRSDKSTCHELPFEGRRIAILIPSSG